jgi:NTE family protein
VRNSLALALALALAACSPTQYQNTPLATGAANPERRSIAPPTADRPAILMAFSGGGTRAAALAESVLRDMHATTYIGRDGTPHSLTDDVRLVSSVSGGSVTAAWFGLRGADGLDALRANFLTQDNMRTLGFEAVDPITWFRLAFTSYTRIRAVEDLFDRELFRHLTMAELNQPDHPFILPNTTDMAGGETFALSPQRFDDICSSFDALPISTAVAASAAFPIALSPVDFRNNGGRDCKGTISSDGWATLALQDERSAYLNLAGYRDARYTNDLRRGAYPFRDIEYLHFLDGGLADNLGVKTLRSALISANDHAHGLFAINTGQIQKLVVILVNARSDPPSAIYQQASTPGLVGAINTVISAPIDANTANSQQALQALLTELAQIADAAKKMNATFKGLKVYGISVDYDQLPADTQAHRELRDEAKDVPTSWTLTPSQLDVTERVGRFLLNRNPCYGLLLTDLGASRPAGSEATVNTPCVTSVTR